MGDDGPQTGDCGFEALGRGGVSAVARVMGDSVTRQMQFERHGDDDHTTTAASREQAEEFLDQCRAERD